MRPEEFKFLIKNWIWCTLVIKHIFAIFENKHIADNQVYFYKFNSEKSLSAKLDVNTTLATISRHWNWNLRKKQKVTGSEGLPESRGWGPGQQDS